MRYQIQWDEEWITGDGKTPVIIGYYDGQGVYEVYDYTKDDTVNGDKFKLYPMDDEKDQGARIAYPTAKEACTEAQRRFTAEMIRLAEKGRE